jgi:D-beta-D-heptose 7-phosphate kinase / D-beta-D-heptose 1-phosphate adenosyltransferase
MNHLETILSKFKEKKILIIGDIILDRYLEGSVSRINPEAPVPVVSLNKEYHELGGAANVALNIISLGGKVSLFGFIGNDANGEIIKNMLVKKDINFFFDETEKTIEKTRVIGQGQQLLRYDREGVEEKTFSERAKQLLLEEAKNSSTIIISDYEKGAITTDLMNLLEPYKYKTFVDPKPKNKLLYQGVFLIKANEKESIEMTSCNSVEDAGEKLKEELKSNIIITRGEKGMSIFAEKNIEIPTSAKEVYDVIGAGDTVISTLALAISSGASLEDAAILANHASGIVIEKKGTYAVDINELRRKIIFEEKKIQTFDELKRKILDNRRKELKIVWTNGCFDLLHVGHVRYLREAKKLGDVLVVGINSDDSVRRIKGQNRPIQTEKERAEIISSLEFVDHILLFHESTVERYLQEFKPDIFAKGGDYSIDMMNKEEVNTVKNYGGEIVFLPLVSGKSSSGLIEKAVESNHKFS